MADEDDAAPIAAAAAPPASVSPTADLHPDFGPKIEKFQQLLRDRYGLETTIGEGYRSPERQAMLYRQGRGGDRGPIVTGAPAGFSFHNYGAAVDLRPAPGVNEDVAGKIVGQAFDEHPEIAAGLNWGGRFHNLYDPLHVELNKPLRELRAEGFRPSPDAIASAGARRNAAPTIAGMGVKPWSPVLGGGTLPGAAPRSIAQGKIPAGRDAPATSFPARPQFADEGPSVDNSAASAILRRSRQRIATIAARR